MLAPQRLATLQQWMLDQIISRDEPGGISEWVLPSETQSADERLGVYQHAYWARLLECMRELFPVLAATLGEEDFARFAVGYLARYSPSSYSLNHLADRFVEHLQETRPEGPSPDWPDFLIELARLEQTINTVFDGPGIEDLPPLNAAALSSLSPESLLDLRFTPAPCLRLLRFAFPVNDFYTAVKQGDGWLAVCEANPGSDSPGFAGAKHQPPFRTPSFPPWPEPSEAFLAITRRDYIVRRIPLEKDEYQVLASLVAGQTLGEALEQTSESITPDKIATWFADWGRLGLLISFNQQADK